MSPAISRSCEASQLLIKPSNSGTVQSVASSIHPCLIVFKRQNALIEKASQPGSQMGDTFVRAEAERGQCRRL
jgi:hypothetical protein